MVGAVVVVAGGIGGVVVVCGGRGSGRGVVVVIGVVVAVGVVVVGVVLLSTSAHNSASTVQPGVLFLISDGLYWKPAKRN